MPVRTDRSKSETSTTTIKSTGTGATRTPRELQEVLQNCGAAITELMGDFVAFAQNDLAALKNAAQALAKSREDDALAEVQRLAHDLKGLGGSIGFPLLTVVGTGLCDLLRDHRTVDDRLLELIDLHVSAMDLIVNKPIMADGGLEGTALLEALRSASESLTD